MLELLEARDLPNNLMGVMSPPFLDADVPAAFSQTRDDPISLLSATQEEHARIAPARPYRPAVPIVAPSAAAPAPAGVDGPASQPAAAPANAPSGIDDPLAQMLAFWDASHQENEAADSLAGIQPAVGGGGAASARGAIRPLQVAASQTTAQPSFASSDSGGSSSGYGSDSGSGYGSGSGSGSGYGSGSGSGTSSPLTWSGPAFQWTEPVSPGITSIPSQDNAEGDSVYLPISAGVGDGSPSSTVNPDPYPLTYDAVGLPPGLSIGHTTGVITGTIDYNAAEAFDGAYTPTVIVADALGASTSQTFSWNVTDTVRPPVLSSIPDQTNLAGDTISLQASATQPDGDQLIYDADNLPPGLSIDSLGGDVTGTIDPSAAQSSPYVVTVTAADQDVTASTTFDWTVTTGDQPPVLTSPGDPANAAGDVVSLPLSATDADNDALTYTASNLPAGLSIDPGSGTISGTILNSAASTTPYTVTVTASDGIASSSQTIQWTVSAVSVTSPGDQSNLDGDAVSLPIAAADADGLALSYGAAGLPPGLGIDATTGVISGTVSATADAGSPYAVTVTATDGTYSESQPFDWTVAPLALTNPGGQDGVEGSAVSLQLAATDNNGAPTFSASGLPAGLGLDGATGLISGTLGIADHVSSPYQVTVTATDGSNSVSQSFVWTVTPRVALANPGPQADAEGDAVSLPLTADSTVGASGLTFSASGLPAGLGISSTTGVIAGVVAAGAASQSPYAVTVTASDGTSSSSVTFPWTVGIVSLPQPGDQTNLDGDAVSLSLAADYHGTGTLAYAADGLPPGLAIDANTGLVAGTIANTADAGGPYSVTVTATDGTNSGGVSFPWNVNADVSLDPLSDQSNGVGDSVSLAVLAGDLSGATLSYSESGLPAGLGIDSASGVISGVVAAGADANSPYIVSVTAWDGSSSVSETFDWTVTHVSLTDPGPQSGADGQAVALALQGDDADGDAVQFGASGLPPRLSIDGATGVISGSIGATADQGGPYDVTVTASDGANTTSQTFPWTVTAVGVTDPGAQTSTEGDTISLPIVAMTGSGTLSYSAGGLPDGLSIDPTTGVVSGVIDPGDAALGPYTITVAASNGTAASSQTFTWNVNPMVSLTAPADPTNAEGDVVSLQLTASDPAGTPSYSADGLPDGLSIDAATGLISGTVATGDAINGPYTVDVTASDGTYSTDQVFTWDVSGADETTPTLTDPGAQANVVGDSVPVAVNAADADGAWLSYSATGLPDGLDIDPDLGVITGTVADDAIQSAPYVVTVTAADGNGLAASQTFDWFVNDSTMTIQGDAIGQEEGAGDQTFTVASFTDPDLNRQATDYTATIAWGDGQTSQGEVDGSNGAYTVSGDHVYLHPGSFPVQVTVTDPAGGTATSTATATISVAPLTATSGFADGTLKGSASLFTLTTFSDANPYDAAASYTAMIAWGDGQISQGAVEGSDGVFTVVGGHAYAFDGTFTVTVTISDADGTTATVTGLVQVGDILAGQTATLNVPSFTDLAWQGPEDFTTTINWGDTGPGGAGPTAPGYVSGEDASPYTVIGWHTYHAAGTYQVTVSVSDPYGNAITATKVVTVAALLDTGYAGSEAATVGEPLPTGDPLAVLAGPLAGGGETPSYAVVNWDDGSTPSTVSLQENGSLYEVPADHTYQSAGVFAVQTLFYDAAGALVEATVSSVNMLAADVQVIGPADVPGNSEYTYKVQDIGNATVKSWKVDGDLTDVARVEPSDDMTQAVVQFKNSKPASGNLLVTLSDTTTKALPLVVVQVIVKDTPTSFAPNASFKDKNANGQGYKGELETAGNKQLPIDPPAPVQMGTEQAIGNSPNTPALKWEAEVTLVGPGPNKDEGVDHIQVGFQQVAVVIDMTSLFANTRIRSSLMSVPPQRFLDVAFGRKNDSPWYDLNLDPNPPTYLPGSVYLANVGAGNPTVIGASDNPRAVAITVYDKNTQVARRFFYKIQFTLNVAASTTQKGYDMDLFREASADWSWDASGAIAQTGKDNNGNILTSWTPSTVAGVTPPGKAGWNTNITLPVPLLTGGDLLNDAFQKQTYTTK